MALLGLPRAQAQSRPPAQGASAQGAPAQSGPFVDGVSLGLGLAAYHGEMMAEGTFTMGDVLRGGIDAFVGIDKAYEPLFFGVEAGFVRIHTRNNWRSYENHVFRLEGQAGVGIDAIRPNFFRIFTGISVLAHNPRHDASAESIRRNGGFEVRDQDGMTISAAIPLILAIDDHVRVGVRWMVDDYIDNAAGGGVPDFLFHLTLTHRFDLR